MVARNARSHPLGSMRSRTALACASSAPTSRMQLLATEAEIRAAIAMLQPVARSAAHILANHLLKDPELLGDDDALEETYLDACHAAMDEAWWGADDPKRVADFLVNHGDAVFNLAISIVVCAGRKMHRQRLWGWLGRAGAFVAGAFLASLFS